MLTLFAASSRPILQRFTVAVVGAVLVGELAAGALPAALPAQTAEEVLASATAELAQAEAALSSSEVVLTTARDVAVGLETQLDEAVAQRDNSLRSYSDTRSSARDLAVDAYVRGASVDELRSLFDPEEARDDLLRRFLTQGSVQDATVVAAELRRIRLDLDVQTVELLDNVSTARDNLASAQQAKIESSQRVERARASLAAAEENVRAVATVQARADAAAAAAAARVAAARRAAATTRPAASSSGGGAAYSGPVVDLAAGWAKLRQCESGGNYSSSTGNGYYGAYQFDVRTWQGVGGSGLPSDASPEEQDYRAFLLYQKRGRYPWPHCGRYLP